MFFMHQVFLKLPLLKTCKNALVLKNGFIYNNLLIKTCQLSDCYKWNHISTILLNLHKYY